jgi:hypothetical protein
MRPQLIVVFIVIFNLCISLHAQNAYFSRHNQIGLAAGWMFNVPDMVISDPNVKPLISDDGAFAFSWMRFGEGSYGIRASYGVCGQSVKYETKTPKGLQTRKFTGSGRTTLSLGPVCNFFTIRHFNVGAYIAPQVHFNKTEYYHDSLYVPMEDENGYNVRTIGAGIIYGLNISYKLTKHLYFFFTPAYQTGFLTLREAPVPSNIINTVFSYSGTGPSVMGGLIFTYIPKPAIIETGTGY